MPPMWAHNWMPLRRMSISANTSSEFARPEPFLRSTAGNQWSLVLHVGKRLRYVVDALVARWSLIPNEPLLDPDQFDWIRPLRAQWPALRTEAQAMIAEPLSVPPLAEISPDHGRIAIAGNWRSYFLHGYGYPISQHLRECPTT